jgi:hypothetical protein
LEPYCVVNPDFPDVVVFDYGEADNLASVDKNNQPDIIFICKTLVESLENVASASDEFIRIITLLTTFTAGTLERHLTFIVFSCMFHELGHWLTSQISGPRRSDPKTVYENWFGKKVGDPGPGKGGEAGFMLEAHLWGGVLRWGLSDQNVPRKRISSVREAKVNKWSTIRFLMLHRGPVYHTERLVIGMYILSFTHIRPHHVFSPSFR